MEPGSLLAQRYRIEARLGTGGMGDVYLAEDTHLGRKVALKMLPPAFTHDPDRIRRFEREARAVSALNHPNILTIHEFGRVEAGHFIVTEFVDGSSLRELLSKGPIDVKTLLDVGAQAAEALATAHRAGIVHRDIKPENIMVRRDGYVKLLDFGLAKLAEMPATEREARPATRGLTAPGLLVGSIPYMSPEQVEGRPIDHRTDLFSLGCVLYEMATGTPAFGGDTFIEVLRRIATGHPHPATDVNRLVPAELQRIIDKCLAKNPGGRYQHADELAVDLRRLRAESETGGAARTTGARLPRRHRNIHSLAILPLVNAIGDPDIEYLSDGITESLIGSLAQLPHLRVMAQSAVSRYKGQAVDAQMVGRDLGVEAVLAGRLLQRGDTLILAAELVDVAQGWQLWGGQFHRPLADAPAVEAEISREISDRLRLRLSRAQRQRLSRAQTQNTGAYQAYLKGRYYWNRRTEEGLKNGLASFEEAIAQDPLYPQAYAGLADSYIVLAEFGILPSEEALPKAKAAALKALDLDGSIAEAHASLGKILEDEYDWSGAGREYRTAIRLNPSYATACHWYARYLTKVGRLDEAVLQIKRALELDPLSLIVGAVVGEILFFARRYDEALVEFQKTLDVDPPFAFGHLGVGLVSLFQGRYAEAIDALRKAVEHSQGSPPNVVHLGIAYALGGMRNEALEIAEALEDQPKRKYQLAEIYAALGDRDRAFMLLEEAWAQRSLWMRYIKVDPCIDSLRDDPRFADLARRVGLPP